MFKYAWVTETTEPEYQAVLDKQAESFYGWRQRRGNTGTFDLWWRLRGPTGFPSTEESFRFKKELAAHLQRAQHLSEKML